MSVILVFIDFKTNFTDMKYRESPLTPANRLVEATGIGAKITRLRTARKLRQLDAAARAGLSRSTAVLIEKGDPGRTIAQILRYLEAIAPGLSLLALLQESDPSLKALERLEVTQRVRPLSAFELQKLDF